MSSKLIPQQALRLIQQAKAVLVDLRSPADFAQAHPEGAINLPFSSKRLAERLAMVLPDDNQIILLADDEAALPAIEQLHVSSFNVVGSIQNGFSAWAETSLPARSLTEIAANDLPASHGIVLDVREPIEWSLGHVPGAILITLGDLRHKLDVLPPRQTKINIICESGIRSSIAASVLLRAGFTDVSNVTDGTHGYRNTNYPLEYWKEETSV